MVLEKRRLRDDLFHNYNKAFYQENVERLLSICHKLLNQWDKQTEAVSLVLRTWASLH